MSVDAALLALAPPSAARGGSAAPSCPPPPTAPAECPPTLVAFGTGEEQLILESETLVLSQLGTAGPKSTGGRSCLPFSQAAVSRFIAIPLYDVLWAELTPDFDLVVSYAAHPSKTTVRIASLSIRLLPAIRPSSDSSSSGSSDSAPSGHESFVATLLARAYRHATPRRRARVLVNPRAGPGGALARWTRDALPVFAAARARLTVSETTYAGEGADVARDLDLDAFDCVVVCSGDGLAHEVFNGFASRPDAGSALARVPLGHIPCGSGNAMSRNLNGTAHVGPAALAIVKGVTAPIDLISVTQPGRGRYLSFLSQSVGLVAESDLATEHMRWMGASRFDVGFLQRVLAGRVYPCDVAARVETADKDEIRIRYGCSSREGEVSRDSWREDGGGGGDDRSAGDGKAPADEGLPPLRYGVVTDELPKGWELTSHDNLGTLYCGNMAYMSADVNFFPAAAMRDGAVDLATVDRHAPFAAVNLMLKVSSGTFFDDTRVRYSKVVAYRVTPRARDGYISIDGERVPFEPFQAEVHRGLGRVICRRGVYEAEGPRGWESSVGESGGFPAEGG